MVEPDARLVLLALELAVGGRRARTGLDEVVGGVRGLHGAAPVHRGVEEVLLEGRCSNWLTHSQTDEAM